MIFLEKVNKFSNSIYNVFSGSFKNLYFSKKLPSIVLGVVDAPHGRKSLLMASMIPASSKGTGDNSD